MTNLLINDNELFDDFFDDGCELLVLPWLDSLVGQLLAPGVFRVGLANARGSLLGVGSIGEPSSWEHISGSSATIVAAVKSNEITHFQCDGGNHFLLVPARNVDGPRGAVLAVYENVPALEQTTSAENQLALQTIARLAFENFEVGSQRDEAQQRIKQLVAEQRTLVRDHKIILETNLNDREKAMHEKQALIADLENQVEMRTQQLNAAKQRAESANADKSRFLANMSHEIRTPMTAILGFTDLMLTGEVDQKEVHHALHTIRRNGDHLLTLINDILDLSKIESGKLPIELLDTRVDAIIADVIGLLRVRAEAKKLRLSAELDGAIPDQIKTDPTRLRQILVNIVGNAIKFTERGEIVLTVSIDREAPDGPALVVRVRDSGIGMTPAQVERIFEPFVQADASTTRKFGGTGLGLAISRHLSVQLGGGIKVRSREGAGTEFTIRVAAGSLENRQMIDQLQGSRGSGAGASAKPTASQPRVAKLPYRILLAEDGPDNQRLITFMLKKVGATVDSVVNGKLAVDAVLGRKAAEDPFDVILMDMQMPEMDGYEATRTLRKAGYAGKIIALTAHAMVGDRERCIEAGCDDYVTKPITRSTFFATIERVIAGKESKANGAVNQSSVLTK